MGSEKQLQDEKILILDFGGQYKQLIGRRVREEHVYCEIKPCTMPFEEIRDGRYAGIILTGGPDSVYADGSRQADARLLSLGIPVLGICYGAQWVAHTDGGRVDAAGVPEYGKTETTFAVDSPLFEGMPEESVVWMSHNDQINALGEGYVSIAHSAHCPVAAFANEEKQFYGMQFHPEVEHTEQGRNILHNFLYRVCGVKGTWQMDTFIQHTVATLKEQLAGKKALCAFSGGVDSSVAALLVHQAIGQDLTCVFVDHGMLRKDEADTVEQVFKETFGLNLIRVDASERYLDLLKGVTDPEQKRKIIGEQFIRVFEEEAQKIGAVDVLVQGTIYPDVIESGVGGAVIKSHHNVGGLPEHVAFTDLVEPLRALFKDEVRAVGTKLGIPDDLVWRQPFPGPGLAVRIIGEITREKIRIVQEADAIWRDEVKKAGLARDIGQYFAVLTNVATVGVMGDARTYDRIIGLRAVTTNDFMTAEWARIPYDVLDCASNRIVNEVDGVSRVVYDITSKPPATIEWE
ncbi:MAG: glutamine-hydrolyzing GMP synthase [Peptoniphilaceae bacterium]|nr:glutamine-hydrolyzing GMP synthase [Peptoniphilaceae bacterium]MDY6086070.1 glutamine-hydrolyzing GMP synthase [Peptoniphilaceae bacterium]